MNKRQIGKEKEELACRFLEEKGYQILEKNYQCRSGEIDVIAKEGSYLCFIEVKYRKNKSMGYAQEAIHKNKQHKIIQVSRYYLYTHGCLASTPCRFDAVVINYDQIELIKNAFMGF